MSARTRLAPPVLLAAALAVPASASGQARVLGSPLANPPNVQLGCETRPALGDDGGTGTYYATASGQPDCTWRQQGVVGVTDYNQDPRTSSVPGTGRIVNIRVRSGPNPALIRFTILRQLSCANATCQVGDFPGAPSGGTYCCYFQEEGPLVRPNAPSADNPNGITDFPTNFFVARNVDNNGVLAADHVAVSAVSGTGSLPLHSTGRNNAFHNTAGSVNASFWYPRMGALPSDRGPMGGAGRREDGMPGMEILLQWTWCPAGQTCAPPAQPVPPTAAQPQPASTTLSGLGLAPARFRSRRPPGSRLPLGTSLRFSLSQAADVTFAVERLLPGRRLRNGRCVAQTPANRPRPRCTRAVAVGTFTRAGRAGANATRFDGRVRGRALPAGSYRLTATAGTGPSATARRAFTVVAP